ncbi:MAG: PilN domain-containing protein [Desulfobulbaceae bacterium]|nr:PilN domain-containing protein [Desulfobulbaceae bacterium]
MVYINLLPVKEIKQRVQARQQVFLFSVVFLGLLACLVFAGVIHQRVVSGLEDDVAKLKLKKKEFNQVIAEIKKIEQDKKLLRTRIDIITRLRKEADLTVRVMDEVAKATPPSRVYINSLSQQGNNLSLSGVALDNRTIASYMDTLKMSPFVNNVELRQATLLAQGGKKLKSFSFACKVSPPPTDDESKTNK